MKSTVRKSWFLVGLAGLVALACNSDEGRTSLEALPVKNSGIEGQVLRGPIRGGPIQVGEAGEEGFSALFYVHSTQNKLVASFQSDENGNYQVALFPGTYNIIPDASAPFMNPEQQVRQVMVEKNKFTIDTLHFDTGLR